MLDVAMLDALRTADESMEFSRASALKEALRNEDNRDEVTERWKVSLEQSGLALIAEWWKVSAAVQPAEPKVTDERKNRGGRPAARPIHGDKVRELRGTRSQKAFARQLRMSEDRLQDAEAGKATLDTIHSICAYARRKGHILSPETLETNSPQKTGQT